MKQKREQWVDIAKGLGIIAVVMGHSQNEIAQHYLFWFHMPLFFVLSGYIFKPISEFSEFIPLLKKRTKQLLIPYASFAFIFMIIIYGIYSVKGELSIISLVKDSIRIIYGGEILTGPFGVFWFITCLYLTQLIFTILIIRFKKIYIQFIIIGIAYILAHVESRLLLIHNVPIPWNADVMLIAIFYFAFGFYARQLLSTISKHYLMTIVFMIFAISFILSDYLGILVYQLDLKNHIYNNLFADFIIPLTFTIIICALSQWFTKVKFLKFFASIGTMSLPIMYMHIPLNILLRNLTFQYGLLEFTLVGVIIPLILTVLILNRFSSTRLFFLGNIHK